MVVAGEALGKPPGPTRCFPSTPHIRARDSRRLASYPLCAHVPETVPPQKFRVENLEGRGWF